MADIPSGSFTGLVISEDATTSVASGPASGMTTGTASDQQNDVMTQGQEQTTTVTATAGNAMQVSTMATAPPGVPTISQTTDAVQSLTSTATATATSDTATTHTTSVGAQDDETTSNTSSTANVKPNMDSVVSENREGPHTSTEQQSHHSVMSNVQAPATSSTDWTTSKGETTTSSQSVAGYTNLDLPPAFSQTATSVTATSASNSEARSGTSSKTNTNSVVYVTETRTSSTLSGGSTGTSSSKTVAAFEHGTTDSTSTTGKLSSASSGSGFGLSEAGASASTAGDGDATLTGATSPGPGVSNSITGFANNGGDTSIIATTASPTSRIAGAAGAQEGDSATVKDGGSKLSSFAIVGIVGGILVGFIILYVVWYQWRKKRQATSSSHEDEDGEKGIPDDTRMTRSSFGNDPFDDRQTGYGETWYGDDHEYRREHRGRTEYDGQTEYGRETKYMEDGQRWEEYEYDHEHDQDGDGHGYRETDDPRMPQDSRQTEYDFSTYEGGLTAAYLGEGEGDGESGTHTNGGGLNDNDTEPMQEDPFKPPRPIREPSIHSAQFPSSVPSRPGTEAYYGSIYDRYAPSRPQTSHGQELENDNEPSTPATSTLLPWLGGRASQVPPMPVLPPAVLIDQRRAPAPPQAQGEYDYETDDFAEPRRPPPAAFMAQTPAMAGNDSNWNGAIPNFR